MREAGLESRLIRITRQSAALSAVMALAQALDAPDWLLVSGCVYQTVWNHLTGRPPDYGLKDYDLFYFDSDVSYEAEDMWIRRAQALAAADPATKALAPLIEVRNQARVHLWFEAKFGEPYAPLRSSQEALQRFLCPAFAVGLALGPDGRARVTAPFGLEDCFSMRLQPNPRRDISKAAFDRVTASCLARWPEAVICAAPSPD